MKNKRLGIGLIVFGVLGALVLLGIGNRVRNSAITHFGRVNVGCQVTFTFPSAGTYFVYVEQGRSRQHNNGCEPSTRGDALSVAVTREGVPVELTPDTSVTYDSDGLAGQSMSRFEVEADSRFQVTVTGPDSAPSVAMGIDPVTARRPWRLAAGLIGALGVIGGGVVLANRRRAEADEPIDDEWPVVAPTPTPSETPADITSPTGITVRKPQAKSSSPPQPRPEERSTSSAGSKPPYLPASAIAAVEARRRSTAFANGPARDTPRATPADFDRERTMNTAESPVVPVERPPASVVGPPSEPLKQSRRGGAVVSSGSSRRRSPVEAGAPATGGAPERVRPPQPTQPRSDSQPRQPEPPMPARTEPPIRSTAGSFVPATPPKGVETVGDVLGDLSSSTPPAGGPRPPERSAEPVVQRPPRQRQKPVADPAPKRAAGKRLSPRPVERPNQSPPPGARRLRGGGESGGMPRARRRPVVGDFLDEMTVGDVLDDSAGVDDSPPVRRRRRTGAELDDRGASSRDDSRGALPGRSRRPSARRDVDEFDDRNFVDRNFVDDEFDAADYDVYGDADYRRSRYVGYADRDRRGRDDGRSGTRRRQPVRARPDRGPEPMREWGTDRPVDDDEMFGEYEDESGSSKSVVPPPPPPIRMPPPLPEPDRTNGDPPSVEDEWHDAGDDTGAWRWWSPPDPRNRR